MAVVPDLATRAGRTGRTRSALRLEHLADLLPRGVHELLLLVLDDARAEARRRRGSADRDSAGAPSCRFGQTACRRVVSTRFASACQRAVQRRRDDRIGIARGAGSRPGRLIRSREVLLQRPRERHRPRSRTCRAASGGTLSAGAARRRASGCRRAPACRRRGTFEPGVCTSISRKPTRGSTGFGTSSRTSVSKSPFAPVRKYQRW